MKVFFRRLLFYVLPGVLIFLGNDKIAIIKLDDENKSSLVKFILFCVGLFIINGVVPVINEKDKIKVKNLTDSLEKILGEIRKIASIELEKIFYHKQNEQQKFKSGVLKPVPIKDLQLNIRIFVPKTRTLAQIWNKQLFFEYRKYDSLHVKEIDEDLKFQVLPKDSSQGLIGRVYESKSVKFDFQLNTNSEAKKYKLSERQLDVTRYCKFGIAAPIFKKDTDKIIAIVTFDSEIEVEHPSGTKWQDIIKTYCKIIHKNHTLLNSK
jgi:hypothetical protein